MICLDEVKFICLNDMFEPLFCAINIKLNFNKFNNNNNNNRTKFNRNEHPTHTHL